jgi:tetratricopeptide (TPR) repeat protein
MTVSGIQGKSALLAELRSRAETFARLQVCNDEAVEANERILEISSTDVAAYTRLGRCFRVQGKDDSACAMYEKALRLDPRNRIAMNALIELKGAGAGSAVGETEGLPGIVTKSHDAPAWICHWQNRYWHDDFNREYKPIWYAGSNNFSKRGVAAGHRAYIVTLIEGQLYLGGRMIKGDRVLG